MRQWGTFYIKSTRNDDFSNRSHRAVITVKYWLSLEEWVAAAIGGFLLLLILPTLLLVLYQRQNPTSRCSGRRCRCGNFFLKRCLMGEEKFEKWRNTRKVYKEEKYKVWRENRFFTLSNKNGVSSGLIPNKAVGGTD